jgi:hypothetical protein
MLYTLSLARSRWKRAHAQVNPLNPERLAFAARIEPLIRANPELLGMTAEHVANFPKLS